MNDPKPTKEDRTSVIEMRDDSARRPFNPDGGEDESSTSDDGDESGSREDQKPITASEHHDGADAARDDDRHKTENLTKAGRDTDPDDGSE